MLLIGEVCFDIQKVVWTEHSMLFTLFPVISLEGKENTVMVFLLKESLCTMYYVSL
jgi:hypothetical protein